MTTKNPSTYHTLKRILEYGQVYNVVPNSVVLYNELAIVQFGVKDIASYGQYVDYIDQDDVAFMQMRSTDTVAFDLTTEYQPQSLASLLHYCYRHAISVSAMESSTDAVLKLSTPTDSLSWHWVLPYFHVLFVQSCWDTSAALSLLNCAAYRFDVISQLTDAYHAIESRGSGECVIRIDEDSIYLTYAEGGVLSVTTSRTFNRHTA